jgi:hypothetical protein
MRSAAELRSVLNRFASLTRPPLCAAQELERLRTASSSWLGALSLGADTLAAEVAVGTEGLVAALQGVADWAQATEATMPTLLARTLLWALPESLLPPPMPASRAKAVLEATPEEVDDKLADVIAAERQAAAEEAAAAKAEGADAEEEEEEWDGEEEEEEEEEEAEEEEPEDDAWSAPATAAPKQAMSKPRLFAEPAELAQQEGLDEAEELEEEEEELDEEAIAEAEAAAAAAAAAAKAARSKRRGGSATVATVLTAAAKGLSPELAAVMMRAVSETPSMRAAEAAVAAAQAAAAHAEAATSRIRAQLGAPYPGIAATAPQDEAAKLRAEAEAERQKLVRAAAAKERARAARAAKEAARDEELAGGRGGF